MKLLKKYHTVIETGACLCFILLGLVFLKRDSELSSLAFVTAFIVGGFQSAKEGVEALVYDRQLNVDILMILAAVGAGLIGYWLEGALLIFIFSLSSSLEELAMEKSKSAISHLMTLTPSTARKIGVDEVIVVVPRTDLVLGDRVQVRKGEAAPVDGSLISPRGLFDQSMVTGEPIAVDKQAGDDIIGGTINQGATVEMVVTAKVGETVFDNIIRLVENAQKSKSRTATIIEQLEDIYVKGVLILVPSFIAVTYFALGWDLMTSFYRGMILLTVASPCALVASSTPANLSAISRAAQNGVMIKGGDIADRIGDIKVLVTDKTGTLTEGRPQVTSSYIVGDEQVVIALVKTVEPTSNHPIAKAFVTAYQHCKPLEVQDVQELTGQGLYVSYQGQKWKIGKKDYVLSDLDIPVSAEVLARMEELEAEGKILITVSCDKVFQAYFALEDAIKPESFKFISDMKAMGIETVMLTGDQEKTAHYIANRLGIDKVYANCMPEDKALILQDLENSYGLVAMVGDGVNDAPALARAGVSFAVGEGTDIAIESADVVVMDDLRQIPFVIRLSQKMRRIVVANLVFSLMIILSLILANVFQVINLPLGVVGHEGSTILVILNGLRLLAFEKSFRPKRRSKALRLPCPKTCCLIQNRV